MADCLVDSPHLEQAHEHVACVKEMVARQHVLVMRLREAGADWALAEEILCTMEGLLDSIQGYARDLARVYAPDRLRWLPLKDPLSAT